MATKQTEKLGAKRKTDKAAKSSAKPLLKKTGPAKASAPVGSAPHSNASDSKTRHAQPASPTAKPINHVPVKAPVTHTALDQKSLDHIRALLMHTRDRLSGQINSQSQDSLKYVDDTSSEDRTDDFDRELALNIVSSEHDALFEINSAIRRIDEDTYGMCEVCDQPIEKTRLHVLPFARMCHKCQSEHERHNNRFRPFGETLSQYKEPSGDTEESGTEEHE